MCLRAGLTLTALHDVSNNHHELFTIPIKPSAQLLAASKAVSVAAHPRKCQAGGTAAEFGLDASDPFPSVCLWVISTSQLNFTIKQTQPKAVSALQGACCACDLKCKIHAWPSTPWWCSAVYNPAKTKLNSPPAACIQQFASLKCWWQRCLYHLCDKDCRCELDHQQRWFLQAAFPIFYKMWQIADGFQAHLCLPSLTHILENKRELKVLERDKQGKSLSWACRILQVHFDKMYETFTFPELP